MKILINVALMLACVTTSSVSYAQIKVVHVGEKAVLFKGWQKVNDKHRFLQAAPVYQDQDSELLTKGYSIVKSDIITGQLVREIYDYRPAQSAINVFQQIKKSLDATGFKTVFSCSEKECGDIAGWQLYLTPLIGNDAAKQHFISAVKVLENKKVQYVSAFISEIEGQPRALFDVISTPIAEKFDVVVRNTELTRSLEKDGRITIDGIFFATGSASLNNDSSAALKNMGKLIASNHGLNFVIVGHTDTTGDFERNMQLSNARADTVRRALIEQHSVPSAQIKSRGVGSLAPVTSNNDENGRMLNRRVELVQL